MTRRAADAPGTLAHAPNLHKRVGLIECHAYFAQHENLTIKKSRDHIAAACDLQDQREEGVTACDRPDVTMTIPTPA